jgi:Asp-tRNA(Asn)/Glu-tRNA(Gln) amidotransferase A subunit family amidase
VSQPGADAGLPAATVIAELVSSGQVDPLYFARKCAARIAASDGNEVITPVPPERLERARVTPGPMAGVPVLIKDLVDVAGLPTTCGSARLPAVRSARTALAVRRWVQAGAIVVGKANLHAFAWGVTSQNPDFGDVANPRHPGHVPGGSSGGSAAGVAAGLCAVALGTDTGGSARMPAACCGIVGLKPRRSAALMTGVRPLAPSLDCVGPLARTVADCLLAYRALAPGGEGPPRRKLSAIVSGDSISAEAWADLGVAVHIADPPALPAQILDVFAFEAAEQHRQRFAEDPSRYGRDFQQKMAGAIMVSPEAYQAARARLRSWRAEVTASLDADAVIGPTLGAPVPGTDAWEPDVREHLGAHCRIYNYLDWASLAIGNLLISGPRWPDVAWLAQLFASAYGWTGDCEPALAASPAPPGQGAELCSSTRS